MSKISCKPCQKFLYYSPHLSIVRIEGMSWPLKQRNSRSWPHKKTLLMKSNSVLPSAHIDCQNILFIHQRIIVIYLIVQDLLTEASSVLNTGLDGRVYLSQVTLVIPSYWRDARCHSSVPSPKPGVIYQVMN